MSSLSLLACRALLFGGLLWGTGSCTLYEPLLSVPPAVRQPGQVAVSARWQVPYGAQASALWSPVAHGLVYGSGTAHFYNTKRDSTNDYARSRQYEAGLGGYTTIGHTWLSVLAGAGQGRGYRFGEFKSFDLVGGGAVAFVPGGGSGRRLPTPESLGYYDTRFAQVAAWWPASEAGEEWGATLRFNDVKFTELALNSRAQPLPTQQHLQAGMGMQRQARWFSWQLSASYTIALQRVIDRSAFTQSALRVGAGVDFYPFRNKRKAAAAQ